MDLTFQYHPLTQLVHGDDYVSFAELSKRAPEAAEHGDAEFFLFRTDAVAKYGLSDRAEVFFSLPYKQLRVRVDNEDEHHRNETLPGLGDIRVGINQFHAAQKSFQLAVIVGLSLPTGSLNKTTAASYISHEKAQELGVTIPEHSHLQLGTGTLDPFLGVTVLYKLGEQWMLFGSAQATLPLYANRYGYRTAASGSLTLGPAVRSRDSKVFTALFTEVSFSGRDRFSGADIVGPGGTFSGNLDVPNTGRFEVALTPTFTWSMSSEQTLNLRARIPVYTSILEDSERGDVQLAERLGVFLTFSSTW